MIVETPYHNPYYIRAASVWGNIPKLGGFFGPQALKSGLPQPGREMGMHDLGVYENRGTPKKIPKW